MNHSAFCHFKTFAFLHLIGDGTLTCFSISLHWRQYHRNQDVARLGVTSNVHGNDLKKHIFSTFKTFRSQLSVYFTFGTWKQPGGAGNPAVRLIDDALEGSRMVQVRFPQFASSQFSGDFKKERVLTGSSGTNLSGFAVMVQWHLRKRRPAFLVNSTQFSGGKSSPVNFAKFPNWCCHALATMAGLATSLSVDDVLAVDKGQQFSQNGLSGVS